MQKERDELKKRIVKQKGARTWRFGKFCLPYCKKWESLFLTEQHGCGWTSISWRAHGCNQRSNQSFLWKAEIDTGFYQQRCYQFELKGMEKASQNEGSLLDFLDATGPDHRAIQLQMHTVLQGKRRRVLKAIQRLSGHARDRPESLEGASHSHLA